MRKFLLSLLFVLLAVSALIVISDICRRKSPTWCFTTGLWNEPTNSLDILCVGSSHAYCSWNPIAIYKKYGITSYVFGSPSQPIEASCNFIEWALTRQKPKVVMLETFTMVSADGKTPVTELAAHQAIDIFEFGRTKAQLIEDVVLPDGNENYYFDLLQYHSRWKELSKKDFTSCHQYQVCHGYQMLAKVVPVQYAQWNANILTWDRGIHYNVALWIDRINRIVEDHGATLVVFTAPFRTNDKHNRFYRALDRYLRMKGICYLNLLDCEIGLKMNGKRDFYDNFDGHLNVFGSEKMSVFVGKWLIDHGYLKQNESINVQWQRDATAYDEIKKRLMRTVK